jgi:hypothetical protein
MDVRFENVHFISPDQNLCEMMQYVYRLEFKNCTLPDMLSLRKITSCCRLLKILVFSQVRFGQLELTRGEQLEYPSNTSCKIVLCYLDNTTWKVLECFESIGELRVNHTALLGPNNPLDLVYIVEKYGSALKELTLKGALPLYERSLRYLRNSRTVKLQAFTLRSPTESTAVSTIVCKILEKQQCSLESVDLLYVPFEDISWIVAKMPNLEYFVCSAGSMMGPPLGYLKTVRNLSLRLQGTTCYLNITDLPLEELSICSNQAGSMFLIVPSFSPMLSLKRLDIFCIQLKASNVVDICRLMPNLEELEAIYDSRSFDASSDDEMEIIFGPEINTLIHLKVLHLDVFYCLPEFLQQLKLPKLQKLCVTMTFEEDVSIRIFALITFELKFHAMMVF